MANTFQRWWETFGARGTALVLFFLLVLIVGFQNMEPADVDFLFWDLVEVPKLYMIVGCAGIGFVVGYMAAWWGARRRRRQDDFGAY